MEIRFSLPMKKCKSAQAAVNLTIALITMQYENDASDCMSSTRNAYIRVTGRIREIHLVFLSSTKQLELNCNSLS